MGAGEDVVIFVSMVEFLSGKKKKILSLGELISNYYIVGKEIFLVCCAQESEFLKSSEIPLKEGVLNLNSKERLGL